MIKAKENPLFLQGVLFILTGAILFSSKAIFVKLAYRYEVDSVSLLALRMLFALPLYLIIGFWTSANQKKLSELSLQRKDYFWIIASGLIGYYLASLFDFVGLQYVTAGIERLVLYVYPTLVVLIGVVFLKNPIERKQIIALVLTYVGVGIAFLDDVAWAESDEFWAGVGWVFLAAVAFAIYIVLSGQYVGRVGSRRYTVWSMLAACAAIVLHHALQQQLQLFDFVPSVYYYGLAMAIFATVLPSFAIAEGIRLIGSSNAAIAGSIGPISTILLAYFFLGESFGWYQFGGTVLVIIGVLWLSLSRVKE